MAKAPSTAEYFSLNLTGKSKAVLAFFAKIDDAMSEANETLNDTGPKLIAQLIKDGALVVPAGKEARVIRNRFGGGLQIVVDVPRGTRATKTI